MNVDKMRRQLERHTRNEPLFRGLEDWYGSQERVREVMETAGRGLAEFAARMQEHANRTRA